MHVSGVTLRVNTDTTAKGLFTWARSQFFGANISTSATSLFQGQSYNEKN